MAQVFSWTFRKVSTGTLFHDTLKAIMPTRIGITTFIFCFQCNKKMLIQDKNIWGYVRDLYQNAEFGKTVDILHIK